MTEKRVRRRCDLNNDDETRLNILSQSNQGRNPPACPALRAVNFCMLLGNVAAVVAQEKGHPREVHF